MKGFWRINASGNVRTTYQYKVNAGASTIVARAPAKAGVDGPTALKTNIAVPTISCGKQALYFLPDQVLVRDGKRFSDASYSTLQAEAPAIASSSMDRFRATAEESIRRGGS